MKILMENFKKFLHEDDKTPVSLPDVGKVALYHDKESDNQQIILYYMSSRGPFVFGACGIDKLSEKDTPCIPTTYQVSSIYTHPNYRGEGWSKVMYGIAFFLANRMGWGVTSDHWTSTSASAKERSWDKLISRSQLTTKKTPFGNDEFDYEKETSDPFDDCDYPAGGLPATNKSWFMKDYSVFADLYRNLKNNHINIMTTVSNKKQVERGLSDDAARGFDDVYTG
jgi:hypothetical protein|tara:strand:+ start:9205 stop:9879 length:675 start_codon:yes stop_codon:yes gene_type:complete